MKVSEIDKIFKFFWNKWNRNIAEIIYGKDLGDHIFDNYGSRIDEFWSSIDQECKQQYVNYVLNNYKG